MKQIDLACIIDDDEIFVFATRKIMEITKFCSELLVYHNGQEAFDALKPIVEKGERVPELILLDLNMPVMDGWQFLDTFTQLPNTYPITIYIVSSSLSYEDFKKAKSYENVTNYIIKPVTPDTLKVILESFAEQQGTEEIV
jgi:CheY-like chemotaxis protein